MSPLPQNIGDNNLQFATQSCPFKNTLLCHLVEDAKRNEICSKHQLDSLYLSSGRPFKFFPIRREVCLSEFRHSFDRPANSCTEHVPENEPLTSCLKRLRQKELTSSFCCYCLQPRRRRERCVFFSFFSDFVSCFHATMKAQTNWPRSQLFLKQSLYSCLISSAGIAVISRSELARDQITLTSREYIPTEHLTTFKHGKTIIQEFHVAHSMDFEALETVWSGRDSEPCNGGANAVTVIKEN